MEMREAVRQELGKKENSERLIGLWEEIADKFQEKGQAGIDEVIKEKIGKEEREFDELVKKITDKLHV